MGYLQQVVKGLHHFWIGAVGVLQVQTAVLLDIETLVFDIATHAPALAGNGAHVFVSEPKVYHPGKSLFSGWAAFLTEQRMHGMNAPFLIDMFQVIDPAEGLPRAVGPLGFEPIFRRELEQFLKFLPERGRAALLESQDIGPLLLCADREDRAAGIEGITAQAKAGLRKLLFEILGQAGKGFEFAILFDRFIFLQSGQVWMLGYLARVLDKFRADR